MNAKDAPLTATEFSRFAGANVLITGGLGFIGSNLARRLVNFGAQITLVDSLVPEYGGNRFNIHGIEDCVRVNISDVRDRYSLRTHLDGQDFLFNLAGQTSHLDSMEDPFTDLEINCTAQLSILETCRQVNPRIRVVFASTRQIYGRPERLPVDERHRLSPVDVNGINKMAGEFYHILYNDVYDLAASALRLTNTYGPRMRIKDSRQTFVGVWIRRLLEDQPIEVWGGEQRRDFTYVDDCVDALLLAALRPEARGKVFNLGGGEVVSLAELAQLMIDINGSGRALQKEFPADRKRIDIGDYYADDSLIRGTLGWQPQTPLREGLRQTLDFFRPNLDHYR
jgi:UDP-glucose 4-epimerase